MATDVATTRTRLKTLLGSITGIKATHEYTPASLRAANCPQWLIQAGPAEYDLEHWDGENASYRINRTWRLILIYSKAGAGAYSDAEKNANPFFERVEDKLVANIRLNSLDSEISITLLTDTGVDVVEFPPGSKGRWVSVEWQANIKTRIDVEITDSPVSTGSNVRARLGDILENVTGATAVFDYSPRGVRAANAPFFLIYKTDAEHDSPYLGGHRPTRIWRLLLLVCKAGAGAYSDAEGKLDPFFERVPQTLASYLTLNDLSNINNAYILRDTPGLITYPPGGDADWMGCEWEFLVQTKRAVTVGL